jgi:hypothetical protein
MDEAKIAELASQKIIAFAESQNPKIWHQMAMGWNWDNHTAFLNWLIDNPKTDRATILMIYWKDWPNERSKTKKAIEERYHHFYERQAIAYDPGNDEGTDWTPRLTSVSMVLS